MQVENVRILPRAIPLGEIGEIFAVGSFGLGEKKDVFVSRDAQNRASIVLGFFPDDSWRKVGANSENVDISDEAFIVAKSS